MNKALFKQDLLYLQNLLEKKELPKTVRSGAMYNTKLDSMCLIGLIEHKIGKFEKFQLRSSAALIWIKERYNTNTSGLATRSDDFIAKHSHSTTRSKNDYGKVAKTSDVINEALAFCEHIHDYNTALTDGYMGCECGSSRRVEN